MSERTFPGTKVHVREAEGGPESIESVAEECLAMPAILSAIPALEADGFDAVIIGCFDDPGLSAAREITRIPIIGPAKASCHLAAALGDRFGILTVVDEVIPLLYRLMRTYGLQDFVTDIRAVDVPVLKLRRNKKAVLDDLTLEGQAAVKEGADTLVLGCMTMGFLDVAKDLETRLGVPVINPVLASLKAAESAVSMGAVHSMRAYPTPRKKLAAVPV
jgi:allantoin racemase